MELKALLYSPRIGGRIEVQEGGIRIAILDVKLIRQGDMLIEEASESVVTNIVRGAALYEQACERILDMLRQDDGEAFFEAEKFLKQHRPDLYNRIGATDPTQGTLPIEPDQSNHT